MTKPRFWKFEFADALGDCGAFTPTEIATLRFLCDRADEKGKCYPTLKTINEACGRHEKYDCGKHIKKAEQLGFLKVGGHGRKRTYFLNTSVQGIKSAVKSAENSKSATPKSADTKDKSAPRGNSSPHSGRTNTSSNTSKEEIKVKNNSLKEMVQNKKGVLPPDWMPTQQDSNNYPALLLEAERRYNFLVSLGLKPDVPFEDKQIKRFLVDWSSNQDPVWELCVLLMGNRKRISQLKGLADWKLQKAGETMKFGELGAREEEWGFQLVERLFNKPRYKVDRPDFPSLMKFRAWCLVSA